MSLPCGKPPSRTEPAEADRLQGRGVVRALPSAVLCEMPLDPLGAHCIGGDINRNAQVVARETNRFHAVLVLLLQDADVEQTNILEGHRVAGCAIVEDNAVPRVTLAFLPELDNLLYLLLRGHACGDVHLAAVLITQHLLHLPVLV